MTPHTCRQCSADTSVLRLDHLEGETNGIRVAIDGLPVLNCANGHRRFLTPEFPLEFVQHLLASEMLGGITPAVEKGLFRKHLYCPSCGKELSSETNGNADNQARVEIPGDSPVAVELTVPLYPCPNCNRQASVSRSGLKRDVMQAVAEAFRSADIPPG